MTEEHQDQSDGPSTESVQAEDDECPFCMHDEFELEITNNDEVVLKCLGCDGYSNPIDPKHENDAMWGTEKEFAKECLVDRYGEEGEAFYEQLEEFSPGMFRRLPDICILYDEFREWMWVRDEVTLVEGSFECVVCGSKVLMIDEEIDDMICMKCGEGHGI